MQSGPNPALNLHRLALLLFVAATASNLAIAADTFDEMIRSTPWLSPQDALKSFVVPNGFALQLVAAEPDIGKPISMSFDAAGRLWIAETLSYPVETSTNAAPNDVIRILSEFQPDGRARRNDVFADGLNTPDAVAPYKNGAVIFTIPNAVWLQDTNGDGKADRHEVLLGPFGARDTHNLANNFRRGFDGWLYGGQGVGNSSTVKGRDGHEVRFSGSTFRFRPDGSRIEKVGDGQANVFGLCFDPLGNLFTSDCHSMPIYQVIYGGFYPVFGKPHDGLGYAPQMLWHNHGSTAIAGLVECHEPLWPDEFQGNFFLGNVVTCRINRDRIEEHGSTKIAREMPDLVRSNDPWFRPVDVQLGPDGALYIADFYNRIIAHVEVPLSHPGRDRHSGRIWRLVRLQPDGRPLLRARKDYDKLTLPEKVERLGDPSFTHRLTVLNELVDRGGDDVIAAVRQAALAGAAGIHLRVAALWALERLGALTDDELLAAAGDRDRLVRTHAMRIVVERPVLKSAQRAVILKALADVDGFVQRAAADALARHPDRDNLAPLLALRQRAPEEDTHLVYQVRKAIRDQLLDPETFARVDLEALQPADAVAIADVALAIPTPASAGFLGASLLRSGPDAKLLPDWARHIARHGSPPDLEKLVAVLRTNTMFDTAGQMMLFQAVQQGSDQRGLSLNETLRGWAEDLSSRLLLKPAHPGRQKFAADLSSRYRLTQHEAPLAAIANDTTADPEARAAAFRAVLTLTPDAHLAGAAAMIEDANLPTERRAEVLLALAKLDSGESRQRLVGAMRRAPERLALRIATALAGTREGGQALLQAVADGQAPAQLLADRGIKERLLALRPQDAERLARLSATAREDSDRLQKIAAERRTQFLQSPGHASTGEKIFQANCSVCHSLAGKGGNVGPQLDGIGHRGLERLCEDVLNPNRNVDRIFRHSIVTLKNGDVLTGLFRRDEGALTIFVDASGKELSVRQAEIEERRDSEISLMPENFSDLLPASEFNHLMAYLLSQKVEKPAVSDRRNP